MAGRHALGTLQPDGRNVAEPTFDPVHVAQAIVHIANLPNSVTVLDINIMCVFCSLFFVLSLSLSLFLSFPSDSCY